MVKHNWVPRDSVWAAPLLAGSERRSSPADPAWTPACLQDAAEAPLGPRLLSQGAKPLLQAAVLWLPPAPRVPPSPAGPWRAEGSGCRTLSRELPRWHARGLIGSQFSAHTWGTGTPAPGVSASRAERASSIWFLYFTSAGSCVAWLNVRNRVNKCTDDYFFSLTQQSCNSCVHVCSA